METIKSQKPGEWTEGGSGEEGKKEGGREEGSIYVPQLIPKLPSFTSLGHCRFQLALFMCFIALYFILQSSRTNKCLGGMIRRSCSGSFCPCVDTKTKQ